MHSTFRHGRKDRFRGPPKLKQKNHKSQASLGSATGVVITDDMCSKETAFWQKYNSVLIAQADSNDSVVDQVSLDALIGLFVDWKAALVSKKHWKKTLNEAKVEGQMKAARNAIRDAGISLVGCASDNGTNAVAEVEEAESKEDESED